MVPTQRKKDDQITTSQKMEKIDLQGDNLGNLITDACVMAYVIHLPRWEGIRSTQYCEEIMGPKVISNVAEYNDPETGLPQTTVHIETNSEYQISQKEEDKVAPIVLSSLEPHLPFQKDLFSQCKTNQPDIRDHTCIKP